MKHRCPQKLKGVVLENNLKKATLNMEKAKTAYQINLQKFCDIQINHQNGFVK